MKGLVCGFSVGISVEVVVVVLVVVAEVVVVVVVEVVVVDGGRVVWTKSSSSNKTCVSELLIKIDLCYLHPDSMTCRCVSLILHN